MTAWVAGVLPHLSTPLRFVLIGAGRSNLTFRVDDTAGRSVILRRPPLGRLLPGAHDVGREHRLLDALHPAGVRVPRPLGLCEDDEVTGAPFYVMEAVEGRVVTEVGDLGPLGPAGRATASRSLIDELASLHAVDIDASGLGGLARREEYAQRQLKGWWRQWEASRTRDIPEIERVRDTLHRAVPVQHRDAVVHGDYKLENVVVDDTGEVRAILDWELCTLGDPVADLGTLLTYWIEPDDPPAWALSGDGAPTRQPGFLTRSEMIEAYARATGDPLDGLRFHEALASWKLAIILQGVLRRARDAPGGAEVDQTDLDRVIDALVERAATLAGTLR